MAASDQPGAPRPLSEGEVAATLGVERLELYFLAAKLRVGRYDPLTHLLVFTPAEVERMVAWRGVARRAPTESAEASKQATHVVPEPERE